MIKNPPRIYIPLGDSDDGRTLGKFRRVVVHEIGTVGPLASGWTGHTPVVINIEI